MATWFFCGRSNARLFGVVVLGHTAPRSLCFKPCTHVGNTPCGYFAATQLHGRRKRAICDTPPKRGRAERQRIVGFFGGLDEAREPGHCAVWQLVEVCADDLVISHVCFLKNPLRAVQKGQNTAGADATKAPLPSLSLSKKLIGWANASHNHVCERSNVHGGDFLSPAQSPYRFPRSVGALSFWRCLKHTAGTKRCMRQVGLSSIFENAPALDKNTLRRVDMCRFP